MTHCPIRLGDTTMYRYSAWSRTIIWTRVLGGGSGVPRCGPPPAQIVATPPPNLAVLLTHCGQLILRKISKLDATRCHIIRLKGKGSPYPITERRVPELIPAVSLQVT